MKKLFLLAFLIFIGSSLYSQIPNPPTLISPPNGSTGVNPSNVFFDWSDVTGVIGYRLQVSIGPTTILDISNLTNSQYQISPGVLSGFILYNWRVNVTTSGGTSNWSPSWNFTTGMSAPSLIYPPNGAMNISIHPLLDWTSVPGATSYILHISKSPLFDSLVVCDTFPIAPITLEYNTTYYWRVCGMNSGGIGPWSSVWNFTTIMQTPPAPVLLYPCGVVAPLPVTLDWTDVPGATFYRVQVSTSPTFTLILINTDATVSQYTIPLGVLNYSATFYWRVSSGNAGGLGTYSTPCSFTTQNSSGIKQISSEIPTEYKLYNNYPNPFNPKTIIRFQIKDLRFVTLKIYDILGKEIETLVKEKQSPGTYEVSFDGSNLPSGIYFYTIHSGDFTDTKRMLLIK